MAGVISTVAWFLALVPPFFLVRRWKGAGFVLAVLIGWAVIGLENEYLRSHDFVGIEGDEIRTAAVFCGVWLALGWGFYGRVLPICRLPSIVLVSMPPFVCRESLEGLGSRGLLTSQSCKVRCADCWRIAAIRGLQKRTLLGLEIDAVANSQLPA